MSDTDGEGGFYLYRKWNDFDHSAGQLVPSEPQIVAMKVIYNICNCPATTYYGDAAPIDMVVYAITDQTVTQTL